jgi:hypothetical protein
MASTLEQVDVGVDATAARLRGSASKDAAAVRSLLKTLRNKNIRRPDLVLEFAPELLTSSSLLGNEGTNAITVTSSPSCGSP